MSKWVALLTLTLVGVMEYQKNGRVYAHEETALPLARVVRRNAG